MATSEPLVPNDLPYGDRQRFVETARAGGVSLSNPAGGASGSPSPSRPLQPGVIPPNYDVFANRQPSAVAPDTVPVTGTDMRKQLLLQHPNPIYRDLAQRILT